METISDKVPFDANLVGLGEVPPELRQFYEKLQDTLSAHAAAINGSDVWEDEVAPSTTIRLPASAPPSFNDDTLSLDFSATVTNNVGFVFQLKHAWKEGTGLRFHMHVYLATAPGANNTSYWTARYAIYSPMGDTIPDLTVAGNWTAITPVTHTHQVNGLTSDIIVFPEFIPTGKTVSSILKIVVSRVPTNGADIVNQVVKLDSADVHFLRNSSGSRREYVK